MWHSAIYGRMCRPFAEYGPTHYYRLLDCVHVYSMVRVPLMCHSSVPWFWSVQLLHTSVWGCDGDCSFSKGLSRVLNVCWSHGVIASRCGA
jgi:hypothetical protein